MTRPKTSVIIPCKNMAHVLSHQLRALAGQSDHDFDLVISDNGSTDDLSGLVDQWLDKFRSITILDASDTPGAAHARNLAIFTTTSDYLLFCDADDVVSSDWVKALCEQLDVHEAATGPLIHTKGGVATGVEWNTTEVPVASNHLPYAPGSNLAVRARVARELNGFDPNLSIAQEDVDFGWRLSELGYSIGHSPQASVRYGQETRPLAGIKKRYRYGKAFVQLIAKHPEVCAPAQSLKWRLRWWIEYAKQLVTKREKGSLLSAAETIAFQLGRFLESIRLKQKTPMW